VYNCNKVPFHTSGQLSLPIRPPTNFVSNIYNIMDLFYDSPTAAALSANLLLRPPTFPNNTMSKDAPTSITRKRSPEIAFADDTPPSSRPPSRTHTKRLQKQKAPQRPTWVLSQEESVRLDERVSGGAVVDVQWPAEHIVGGGMEEGRAVGTLMKREGFTVLCFLGVGVDTLRSLGQVKSLLENLGASVYGVSLGVPEEEWGSCLPIIHDKNRTLTLALGLLHPLGGGRQALDAIVVLDNESRARMVLPVGWGPRPVAGNACVDETGNRQENVVGRVVRGVEWLRGDAVEEMRRLQGEVVDDVEVEMGGVLAGV